MNYYVKAATYESLNNISVALLQCGVTSFLPTVITDSLESTTRALQNIANAKKRGVDGAGITYAFANGYEVEDTLCFASACGMANAMERQTGYIKRENAERLYKKTTIIWE
ncbi:hypothetical protein [Bacillus manliponensis]|uniref:hypothetical protein n=1 Tax=Bacillus manliponensis TaxID=574376 RepID=UPI0035156A94